jgi:hypothetical protein
MTFTCKGVFDSETHALDRKTGLQIALHIAQGLQHFPQLCLHLGSHAIFLTENWVPKIHFNSTILASSLELLHPRYVICVNSPCFSRLHVIIVD